MLLNPDPVVIAKAYGWYGVDFVASSKGWKCVVNFTDSWCISSSGYSDTPEMAWNEIYKAAEAVVKYSKVTR